MNHLSVCRRALVIACVAGILAGCATTPTRVAEPSCALPLNPAVKNGCVVAPQLLWRGAKPDVAAATALVDMGVKTVVNLELLHDDRKMFARAEPAVAGRQDVQYFRVRDWEPLVMFAQGTVDDHVAHFIAITRTQPAPLYVHCRAGRNRTGVMVAAYRVFNGMDTEAAIAEMKAFNGGWFRYDAAYIRGLTAQRREALEVKIAAWMTRLQPDAQFTCADGRCRSVSP